MRSIGFLSKVLLFWLIFFIVQRLVFISYNFSLFDSVNIREILSTAIHGFPLDLSTICYLLFFPYLLLIGGLFSNSVWLSKCFHFLGFCFLAILLLLSFANTLLYKEWQSILSKRALGFLVYPKEIVASLSWYYIFFAVIVITVFQIFFYWMWRKNLPFPQQATTIKFWEKAMFVVLIPLLLFVGARGGVQLIPINESAAYFSSHAVLNHAAVNPIWYLGSSILNPIDEENKFQFMEEKIANELSANLYTTNADSSMKILSISRPNIVLLVLESHTADVISSLGGEKNVCPNLDSLAQSGILFTQIYGSGMRTDQGLISILSAFPPQPDKSIIKYTSKVAKLPSLFKELSAEGYSTSFYYGGEVEFANIGAYLRQSGVKELIDKHEFPKNQLNSKWGAHDEFVMSRQLKDLSTAKEPFFSVLLTLSNHEPFETPVKDKFSGKDEANRFRNTAAYTDSCIGAYFSEAKKSKWYTNTLFILVADHGHRLPQHNDLNAAKSKHIPLLFYGNAIDKNWKKSKISKIGTQQDLAATLLQQLNIKSVGFEWSKDLLNPTAQDFAYYSNENVLGWITNRDTLVYSFVEKKNISSATIANEKNAKAYLQKVYRSFIAY